jgi:hypothetical protein
MQRTASVAASVAAVLARVDEHGGDAVEAMQASGVTLEADDAVDVADLHMRLTRQLKCITTYGELIAQAYAAGFMTGQHYERGDGG